MSIDIEMNNSMQMFLIGVSMAIVGNTLIACSLTLQKWCHMREASGGLKASSTPLFWLALAGLIGGEVGNFAAFGFASQTVVSPLGAVSVIVSTVLAAIFLGEPIYRLTLLGIALVLVGSVCVVLFSPPALGALTTNDFVKLLSSPYAYGYMIFVAVAIGALAAVQPRCGHRYVLVNVMLCSLLGSVTVICSTALSKFIRNAIEDLEGLYNASEAGSGSEDFESTAASPVPYLLVPTLVTTAVLQLRFLNKAMESFHSALVVPTYYVTFTLCSITGGIWVFDENWRQNGGVPIPAAEFNFCIGCALCFLGVYLIAMRPADRDASERAAAERAADIPGQAEGRSTDMEIMYRRRTSDVIAGPPPQMVAAAALPDDGEAANLGGAGSRSSRASWLGAELGAVDQQTQPPLALLDRLLSVPTDLRGSISVVTGVGTLQHLHSAFKSWRSESSAAPAVRRSTSASILYESSLLSPEQRRSI